MSRRKTVIKLGSAVIAALAAAFAHFWVYFEFTGYELEPWLADVWFRARGPIAPPPDVTMVAVDEKTYAVLGIAKDRMLPRSTMASFIRRLAEAKPTLVLLDFNYWGEVEDPKETEELAEAFALVPTVIGTLPSEASVLPPNQQLLQAAKMVASDELMKDTGIMPGDNLKVRRFRRPRRSLHEMPTLAEVAADWGAPRPKPLPHDFIKYYGPGGTIPSLSAHELLELSTTQLEHRFRGKFVFVGVKTDREVAGVARDHFLTPYSQTRTYGVEIHATAAGNIRYQDWLRRFRFGEELLYLSCITGLVVGVLLLVSPQFSTVALLAFVMTWAAGSYICFTYNFFFPGITAVFLCTVVWIGRVLTSAVLYRREALVVTAALELSMAPQVFSRVRGNALQMTREAEERYTVCLFADLEKFSSLTQGLSSRDHQQIVNDFCDAAESLVLEYEGTLVTVYGDAFFAMWGAPLAIDDPESRALAVAQKLPEVLKMLPVEVKARAGIAAGTSLVGNFGSRRRLHYSAYGEVVNTSARLEALNKDFGTNILVGPEISRACRDKALLLPVGLVTLDTRKSPLELTAVLDRPLSPDIFRDWTHGISAFSSREFAAACRLFEAAKGADPRLGTAANLLIGWANFFATHRTPKGWEGQIYFRKNLGNLSPDGIDDVQAFQELTNVST